jgi:hypothetical protein
MLNRVVPNRPAATTSTSESATCAVTTHLRSHTAPVGGAVAAPHRSAPGEIGTRGLEAGTSEKSKPLSSAVANVKGEQPRVQAGRHPIAGQTLREHPEQRARGPIRHQQTERAPGQGQRQAFEQELPDQVPAARADRQPDTQLALPGRGARNGQAGHVGAGNQEHQADHGRESQQRSLVVLAKLVDALPGGAEFQARAAIRLLAGVVGMEPGARQLSFERRAVGNFRGRLRFLDGHARHRARHDVQPSERRVVQAFQVGLAAPSMVMGT